MPRSRRRHHSRSSARSRSHSHDRDREPKRRKIESYDSPHQRRSVSSEPEAIKDVESIEDQSVIEENPEDNSSIEDKTETDLDDSQIEDGISNKIKDKTEDLKITPKKVLSPKQLQRKIDFEKKRQEKQKEKEESIRKKMEIKEEKERQKLEEKKKLEEEKKKIAEEKVRLKQEKDEQKVKEKQAKQEEKDKKRREKEEKDELKKKEIEEKNKEKQKIEEQKQKTAAAFVNFFVPKKIQDTNGDDRKEPSKFMPFEVKSDMRLAPISRRSTLDDEEKIKFDEIVQEQSYDIKSYLKEIKRDTRKSGKTWAFEEGDSEDDVVFIEEKVGESIVEQKPKLERMRAKFFKFHENQRPPYFGTWKKRSRIINARRPFGRDEILNYDVDSDEEWEEEGEGESLKGTDDEDDDKENDSDDYEVDNEVFVPHDYLSDDERDEEENGRLSPSAHKAKLKLLKREFDEEMRSQTRKLKPRMIGCVWYDKSKSNVDAAMDRYLQPFAMLCKDIIRIKKRSELISVSARKAPKLLDKEHVPEFLTFIHGSVDKRKNIVKEFVEHMEGKTIHLGVSHSSLGRQLKSFAQWKKCPDEGPVHNKMCWYVDEEIRREYNVNLPLLDQVKSKQKKIKN